MNTLHFIQCVLTNLFEVLINSPYIFFVNCNAPLQKIHIMASLLKVFNFHVLRVMFDHFIASCVAILLLLIHNYFRVWTFKKKEVKSTYYIILFGCLQGYV